jgi:hypothetical protein
VSAAPFTKFKMLQKFSKVNPPISGQHINMADDEVCLLSRENFGDLFQYIELDNLRSLVGWRYIDHLILSYLQGPTNERWLCAG